MQLLLGHTFWLKVLVWDHPWTGTGPVGDLSASTAGAVLSTSVRQKEHPSFFVTPFLISPITSNHPKSLVSGLRVEFCDADDAPMSGTKHSA